jgi:hypothetical protein
MKEVSACCVLLLLRFEILGFTSVNRKLQASGPFSFSAAMLDMMNS